MLVFLLLKQREIDCKIHSSQIKRKEKWKQTSCQAKHSLLGYWEKSDKQQVILAWLFSYCNIAEIKYIYKVLEKPQRTWYMAVLQCKFPSILLTNGSSFWGSWTLPGRVHSLCGSSYSWLQSQRVGDNAIAVLKTQIGDPEANFIGLANRRAAPKCHVPSQHKAEISFIQYFELLPLRLVVGQLSWAAFSDSYILTCCHIWITWVILRKKLLASSPKILMLVCLERGLAAGMF